MNMAENLTDGNPRDEEHDLRAQLDEHDAAEDYARIDALLDRDAELAQLHASAANDDEPVKPAPPGKKVPRAPATGWKAELLRTPKGAYVACLHNFISIFANDEAFDGRLAFNEFTGRIEKLAPLPWHRDDMASGADADAGAFIADDVTRAASWLGREYSIVTQALNVVHAAISVAAKRRSYHPVRDWLDGLGPKWDGESRNETSFIRYAGAPDTKYVRAVGRISPIAAVSRIYKPGSKVDTTVILEGAQGEGKSSFIRELFGEAWFLETDIGLGTKDALQDLRGKWGVEFAELDSLSRGEMSKTKSFLTRRVDTYRRSFGRDSEDWPRQAVFWGTTNKSKYLRDDSGNRRFLPIPTGRIDLALVRREREQYWAEAVVRFKRGEPWHITDQKLLGEFEAEQEERREIDPWEPTIAAWLANPTAGSRWADGGKQFIPYDASDGVLTTDILRWALKIEAGKQTKADEMRVAGILTNVLGYVRGKREMLGGLRVRRYRPGPNVVQGGPDGPDDPSESPKNKANGLPGPPGPPVSRTGANGAANGAGSDRHTSHRVSEKALSGGPGGPRGQRKGPRR